MKKASITTSILSTFLAATFFFYRTFISPLLLFLTGTPSVCRFQPTCSAYAQEAIAKHSWRGLLLAIGRLLRCRPTISPLIQAKTRQKASEQGMRWDPVPTYIRKAKPARKKLKT